MRKKGAIRFNDCLTQLRNSAQIHANCIFCVKLNNPVINCEHFQSTSDHHQTIRLVRSQKIYVVVDGTYSICCGNRQTLLVISMR